MRHIIPTVNRKVYKPPGERPERGRSRFSRSSRRRRMQMDHYGQERISVVKKVRLAILIIIIILLTQSIFQLPFLRIQEISLSGFEHIDTETVRPFIIFELSKKRWLFFKNDNYFLFKKTVLKQQLEEKYLLQVVRIDKTFPDGLDIEVMERISGFVIQTPLEYYSLDNQGKKLSVVEGAGLKQTIIADERSDVSAQLPLEFLEVAKQIKDGWHQVLPQDVRIERFHLTDDQDTITLTSSNGFQVFFSPEKNIDQQLSRLAIFLQETSLDEPRDYVDLRFDESLYIR